MSEVNKGISTRLSAWIAVLLMVITAGICAAYIVFTRGLIVTGMNNVVVWGLWITSDISFIALGAGAFMTSATYYLLKIEKFKPITRIAVLLGFICYSMTILTLLPDIGRPERFWHTLVYINPHSVMEEVVWCISLYTTVLVIENIPVVAPVMGGKVPILHKIDDVVHRVMPVIVFVGVILSLLHQSSLGALYGVVKAHPLWYSPSMPLLFIISAMAGGPMLIIFAIIVTSKVTGKKVVEDSLLFDLGKIAGFALVSYLFFKIWHIYTTQYHYLPFRTEELELLSKCMLNSLLWGGEIVLGGIVPAVILIIPRLRRTIPALFLASCLTMLGVILNRWNVTVFGMLATYLEPLSDTAAFTTPPLLLSLRSYTPTWVEWTIVAGVLAYGLLVYTLAVKFLPIFSENQERKSQ